MTATFLERSMSTVELSGSGGTNSSEPNQQLVPFSLRVAHNGKYEIIVNTFSFSFKTIGRESFFVLISYTNGKITILKRKEMLAEIKVHRKIKANKWLNL